MVTWDNLVPYKPEIVHFIGLMNSETLRAIGSAVGYYNPKPLGPKPLINPKLLNPKRPKP